MKKNNRLKCPFNLRLKLKLIRMHGVLVDKTFNRPINLAHFHERKALEFQSDRNFASAIEHHEQALAFLQSMVQDSQDSQVILSINLQCNFHRNRVKLLTLLLAKEGDASCSGTSSSTTGNDPKQREDNGKISCDSKANFSTISKQIEQGSKQELRVIGKQLLELVKLQQEHILYLSKQLQDLHAQNVTLKKSL